MSSAVPSRWTEFVLVLIPSIHAHADEAQSERCPILHSRVAQCPVPVPHSTVVQTCVKKQIQPRLNCSHKAPALKTNPFKIQDMLMALLELEAEQIPHV